MSNYHNRIKQVAVYFPLDLILKLKKEAKEKGMTRNKYIVEILTKAVEGVK